MMKARSTDDKHPSCQPARHADSDLREAPAPQTSPAVRCSQCRKEIPRSAAINPEAGDYALYFCGLTCYRQWLTSHEWTRPRPRR
jgi:hypothetical protein